MMVNSIANTGQIKNIYYYANTHYNQVHTSAVTPVSGVSSLFSVADQEDRLHAAVFYQNDSDKAFLQDNAVAAKEKAELTTAYEDQIVVRYDQSNPYEAARMSMEGSVLSGMYVDLLA
ncbi:MAG: hypothetical protein LUH14_01395 [Clostridiaceae bacterium]|nr:hypothetical protein [Clostridiaceae bacterium]